MSKKLMTLAAGVLTALAFTALPSAASAGEFPVHCEVAAGAACTSTVNGGHAVLKTTGSAAFVTCTSTTGTASVTNNTSTGSVNLVFHGCKESVFSSACTSSGQPSGTIKTNTLVSHNVYLEPNKQVPGALLTGVNVTFSCFFGAVTKTVTGNVLGEFETPNCGVTQKTHALVFAEASQGHQKWKQVTTSGTVFDLLSNNDKSGEAYETASQVGTGTLTNATNTALTC
jgi:hypothetical protein